MFTQELPFVFAPDELTFLRAVDRLNKRAVKFSSQQVINKVVGNIAEVSEVKWSRAESPSAVECLGWNRDELDACIAHSRWLQSTVLYP